MTTIWKYPLPFGRNQLEMPENAELLAVQVQHGEPCLWVRCDPYVNTEMREIVLYGTGHNIDSDGTYIGTVQMHGGALVCHVFDETPKREAL